MGTKVSIHGRALQQDAQSGQLFAYGRPLGSFQPVGPLGNVFFVDSGVAGGSGASPDEAVASIDTAVGLCTANNGDVIYVMPGHAETITAADAIDFDVAGITVIGLGSGDAQPKISFNNTAATVAIDADNVTLVNLRFHALISAVVIGVDVKAGATDAKILDCWFDVDTTTTDEFNTVIDLKAGCTRTLIEGNFIDMGLGGSVAAVSLTGASNHVRIANNRIWGDYSTACIMGSTTLSTNVDIDGNLLVQGTGGNVGTEPGVELLTGTTGIVRNNYIVCNLGTKLASIVGDTVFLFENYYNEDVTGTGGIIGTASADD
jgi:hypothetical protein